MTDIEERVRESLTARAADVEPTPVLWQEVDRRITRRRRLRVAAWSFAGATAVVVAALVVPGLVEDRVALPEIEPVTPSPAEEDATRDDPPGDSDDGDPVDDPTDAVDGPADTTASLLVADRTELRLRGPDGDTLLYTFPAEGDSSIVGLAVRPGSTTGDLTAAVLTQAEGMFDLRELRVVDGRVSIEVFPPAYRPGAGSSAGEGMSVRGPVWSPDGTSLAWLESGTGGTVLRTIGWDDGPGTGERATDNASWPLGGSLPTGSTPDDWVDDGSGSTVIRVTMPGSTQGWSRIRLDRGPDDAWSLVDSEAQVVPVADPAGGRVAAVAGTSGASDARWLLRLTPDAAVLQGSSGTRTPLPTDLLPDDGFAELWLRAIGDDVIVGSLSTGVAYQVSDDAGPRRLAGSVALGDVVR